MLPIVEGFVFCKQKTADEMRISDWSSDVCSSDLMDLKTLVDRPMLLLLGVIWISVHAALMLGMAKLIRAPLFFLAVGSQANIGGAASAPVVASAFHPS